jgi:hypothetical protein
MREIRRGLYLILFGLACAVFNWPLVSLFLAESPYCAFLGLFTAMGLLTAAIGLFAVIDPGEVPAAQADPGHPDQSAKGS